MTDGCTVPFLMAEFMPHFYLSNDQCFKI